MSSFRAAGHNSADFPVRPRTNLRAAAHLSTKVAVRPGAPSPCGWAPFWENLIAEIQ